MCTERCICCDLYVPVCVFVVKKIRKTRVLHKLKRKSLTSGHIKNLISC